MQSIYWQKPYAYSIENLTPPPVKKIAREHFINFTFFPFFTKHSALKLQSTHYCELPKFSEITQVCAVSYLGWEGGFDTLLACACIHITMKNLALKCASNF